MKRNKKFEEPYDPYNDEERIGYWKSLLEGKTIEKLIIKSNKSTYTTTGGEKKEHPGVIGFVVKDVGPVYLSNAAFGEEFGTLELYYNNEGIIIGLPEK